MPHPPQGSDARVRQQQPTVQGSGVRNRQQSTSSTDPHLGEVRPSAQQNAEQQAVIIIKEFK
jgi:hypothetical protein